MGTMAHRREWAWKKPNVPELQHTGKGCSLLLKKIHSDRQKGTTHRLCWSKSKEQHEVETTCKLRGYPTRIPKTPR